MDSKDTERNPDFITPYNGDEIQIKENEHKKLQELEDKLGPSEDQDGDDSNLLDTPTSERIDDHPLESELF